MSSIESQTTFLLEQLEQTRSTYSERYVETIKVICQRQVDLWRTVPWLAFHADGRTGYSDNYVRAYQHGVWMLPASRDGYYELCIDLDDGNIRKTVSNAVITPYDFATLSSMRLDNFNAGLVIAALAEHMKRPASDLVQRMDYEKVRNELNLTPYYRRFPNRNSSDV